jgi:hypothetical protein
MTTISIQNVLHSLSLINSATVGLSPDAYGFTNTTIHANISPQPYLWFNRTGIGDKQVHIFTTHFKVATVTITILVTLTGTPVLSRYSITVFATDEYGQTGRAETLVDIDKTSFQMYILSSQNKKLYIKITVERYANGTFDDAVVTIAPAT